MRSCRLSEWHQNHQRDVFPCSRASQRLQRCSCLDAVAVAAGALQRAGLIEYQRGQLTILNRRKLEEAACECYRVTRDLTLQLYARHQQLVQARDGEGVPGPADLDGLPES